MSATQNLTSVVSDFAAQTGQRDSLTGLGAFAALTLANPLSKLTGSSAVLASLNKLFELLDGYRTVTRLTGLLDVGRPDKLAALATIQPPVVRALATAETALTLAFFPAEHIALFNKFGILPGGDGAVAKFGGIAVFCWFWSLVVKTVRLTLQWFAKRSQIDLAAAPTADDPTSSAQRRQLDALTRQLVQTVSWLIFSMTCVAGKVRPFPAGTFAPLNAITDALSPPKIVLPQTLRGLLGLIAVSFDFIH
jgi:hypothetical protein